MFDNKKKHLEEARARGLYVLAVHNGLILEISFSDWLGIPATCVLISYHFFSVQSSFLFLHFLRHHSSRHLPHASSSAQPPVLSSAIC